MWKRLERNMRQRTEGNNGTQDYRKRKKEDARLRYERDHSFPV